MVILPISFQFLDGNDKLSFKEEFDVINGNTKTRITYYHKYGASIHSKYANTFRDSCSIYSRFIKPDSVVLDIGAYDGDTAIPLSYCAQKGLVYAFEPGECFPSQLYVNIMANTNLPIHPIPAALMDKTGICEFLYCKNDNNGGHPSTNSWVGTYTQKRLVPTVSFQDFANGRDLSKLDFIKIDTEGHDFIILTYLGEIITKNRPVIHAEWFPQTNMLIKNFTDSTNYRIFDFTSLKPINIMSSAWTQDIILIPNEKIKNYKLN